MENTETTQEKEITITRKLHALEKVSDILDRACLGMAIGCMAMNLLSANLLSANWICALIWFNCIIWNLRAIRDTRRIKDQQLQLGILSYLVYEKYAGKQEQPEAKETIDVEPKEAPAEPAEEKKDA